METAIVLLTVALILGTLWWSLDSYVLTMEDKFQRALMSQHESDEVDGEVGELDEIDLWGTADKPGILDCLDIDCF